MDKRLKKGIIGGALLGIICVIGAYVRSGFTASASSVFALWYNRVIIGLVIGAPWAKKDKKIAMARGGLLGLLVSFAYYATTKFIDPISFIAGIVYGVILELWMGKSDK